MTDDNKLSKVEERAGEILKDHNGVYLDKRLCSLKKGFSKFIKKGFSRSS